MAGTIKNDIQLTIDKQYEKWTKKVEDKNQGNPKEDPQNYNDKKMPLNTRIPN